ncbi:hypothetical protein WEU32_04795 [Brevundimonas sp. BH3]|uniref:DUF4139 domain-containing protein n=1 Tax=Brevundimonas sp. BH3 TaxID=3133089 RepID=UPI0032564917
MRLLCAVLAATVAMGPMVAVAQPVTAPVVASHESVSEGPEAVEVVVYRGQAVDTSDLIQRSRYSWSRLDREGLALIVEKRTVDVPAGEGVIRFKGLGTGIVPHSATIDGLPADLVEQNADYELITPFNLLDRAVGQTVSVVRTNATTGLEETHQATIRAGQRGTVLEIDGQFEALDCSGLTERIVFNEVPQGLGATPTLSVRTRATQAGRYTVTLAYLATGLQWSADYVAHLNDDGRSLDLQGWITLANFGGTSFADAPVTVVAGDLSMTGDSVPVEIRRTASATQCWPQGRTHEGLAVWLPPPPPPPPPPPAPAMAMRENRAEYDGAPVVVTGSRIKAKMEELGDYKAYVLPHPTTVAANQMKQVLFFAQDDVPFQRIYSFDLQAREPDAPLATARIDLLMRNDAQQGLGLPVPEGKAVIMADDPRFGPMLAGQTRFDDTPVGLPLRVVFGNAPEVTGSFLLVENTSRGSGTRKKAERTYRIELTNGGDQATDVEVVIPSSITGLRGFRMGREGIRSRIDPDRGVRVWTLSLEAGEQRTFDARFSYDDPS